MICSKPAPMRSSLFEVAIILTLLRPLQLPMSRANGVTIMISLARATSATTIEPAVVVAVANAARIGADTYFSENEFCFAITPAADDIARCRVGGQVVSAALTYAASASLSWPLPA